MKNRFLLILYLSLAVSCRESENDKLSRLVKEWDGKKIQFPVRSVFTVQGKDTVDFDFSSAYKVVMYTDSVGCISCKLQLAKWKVFMQEVNFIQQPEIDVSFLFYFNSKDRRGLQYIMRQEGFDHPVCLDENDEFNKLNHFSSEINFQTFLLNSDDEVIAFGNPIHSPKIKELYLKRLRGDTSLSKKTSFNYGRIEFGLCEFWCIHPNKKARANCKTKEYGY